MDPKSALRRAIARHRTLLVACSGGVDSLLLAYIARQVLGEGRLLCVLLDSPLIPRRAVREAEEVAETLGIPLRIVKFPILGDDAFRANPSDRCYLCKKAMAERLLEIARQEGIGAVADGTNSSDLREHRPGLAACREAGIVHPYIGAGIDKDTIRRMAKEEGLDIWNRPSDSCLATRIPYGEPIDEVSLRMVEEAEEFLIGSGFSPVRVRKHGEIARIEVEPDDFGGLIAIREGCVRAFRKIGFIHVTLDLAGIRSGSMDAGM
ncbi:MAG: ATP-dependent sacrificial sulfur transferase LarE [Methanoculleaceae archaeon]